jgi:hypothetical protein
MAKVILGYLDRKGEVGKGQIDEAIPGSMTNALFAANFAPLTRCAVTAVTQIVPVTGVNAVPEKSGGEVSNNTIDSKVILTFLNTLTLHLQRFAVPAPVLNTSTGILLKQGTRSLYVPKTKEVGEVGLDGTELATSFELAFGMVAGTLNFKSGRFYSK